jgi:hypothetical protein
MRERVALTDDEARQVYQTLSRRLQELALAWVVVDVERKLAAGKVVPVAVYPSDSRSSAGEAELIASQVVMEPRSTRQRKTVLYTAVEDYSPFERLSILIEAVEFATIRVVEIEQAVFDGLSGIGPELTEVQFLQDSQSVAGLSLSRHDVASERAAFGPLAALIEELKRELAASR